MVDTVTGKRLYDLWRRSDGPNPRANLAGWKANGRECPSLPGATTEAWRCRVFNGPAARWDLQIGKTLEPTLYRPDEGGISAGVFSADGRTIITGTFQGFVRRWDAGSGEALGPATRHRGAIETIVVSPDGQTFLTASRDQSARLWELASGKPLSPPLRHKGTVRFLAFSPDGRLVVTAGDDQSLRFWDAGLGIAIGPPWTNQSPINGVTILRDPPSIIVGTVRGLYSMRVPSPVEGEPGRLAAG